MTTPCPWGSIQVSGDAPTLPRVLDWVWAMVMVSSMGGVGRYVPRILDWSVHEGFFFHLRQFCTSCSEHLRRTGWCRVWPNLVWADWLSADLSLARCRSESGVAFTRAKHYGRKKLRKWRQTCRVWTASFNPFTPKSDQLQISPAASQEI